MDLKQMQDTPMTLATIQAFRKMLDVMEEFIRNTSRAYRLKRITITR